MDKVNICIIGAGVIGLAIARELISKTDQLLVVDKESDYGHGISSRNSEVIHAGIYYPEGSLKARLCVRGKELLYSYCEKNGVSYKRCGKLIVATSDKEEIELEGIHNKARANGVVDIEKWSGKRVKEEEPAVNATAALWSPSTGILSSHELMTSYLGEVEAGGGTLATHSRVESIIPDDEGFVIKLLIDGGNSFEIRSRVVINAAGLGAQEISRSIEGLDPSLTPPLYYCRGNYFSLSGGRPFNRLIYPVPDPSGAGLGVHATLDLGGQVKFGPDVDYIDSEDYGVNLHRQPDYYEAIRKYYPDLPDGSLVPAYAGIRPKTTAPGEPAQDFMILGEDELKIPGLIQLFGIESPGLTASLAIAERVKELVKGLI